MKKIFYILTTLALCVTLCGCGGGETSVNNADNTASVEEEKSVGFTDPETKDVLSGSGEKIGERVEYSFEKADFQTIPYDDIKTFLTDTLAEYHEKGFNYCTIVFNDGTGICFSGCMPEMATYGKIDSDGAITDTTGFIQDSETYYVIIGDTKQPITDKTETSGINGID